MATLKEKKEIVETESNLWKELGLNPKQRQFCEYYASSDEFFGNGVQSYIQAYKPKQIGNWYNVARADASRLLTNANILEYVNSLLEMRGLNDPFVDKQLEFLITQHADFKSKLGGIHEYNQLKKRTEGGGNRTLVLVVSGESAKRYDINPDSSNSSLRPA